MHPNLRYLKYKVAEPDQVQAMATRLFLCPSTGHQVQGWFADNGSGDGRETYRAVTCLAVNVREVVHSVRTRNADVAKPQRFAEDRMDTHKNARLTPKGREEMVRAVVDRGMSKAAAARQCNTTPKIVGKWVGRFSADGVGGLRA